MLSLSIIIIYKNLVEKREHKLGIGEKHFEDSVESSDFYKKSNKLHNSQTESLSITKDSSLASLFRSTHKSKLASLMHIEDEYAIKWMKMKEKRDKNREREIRRMAQSEIIHTFRRVAFNSEK